ncbi:MAG: 4,5-DOPA dioxygenase extradiol [Bacteroidia bacterium]|nr:4,5-DOPA dioxygenase extradiol [Bacteroidia bacterium]
MKKYPVLFIGHGSPMNIIAENNYTADMTRLRRQLPPPEAILVVSAHWLTRGTRVTAGNSLEQIYDFYGFPKALYEVVYRAPGSVEIAEKVYETVGAGLIVTDKQRGIDHAAWAVLKHIYPEQTIPVLELSLDIEREPGYHFETGQKMARLRDMNILVIGSGNIVHNLHEVDFNENADPFPWALDFDNVVKKLLESGEFDSLINYTRLGKNAIRSVPTAEHYLPMLYILGMISGDEKISFVHESMQNGSISMRSFISAGK